MTHKKEVLDMLNELDVKSATIFGLNKDLIEEELTYKFHHNQVALEEIKRRISDLLYISHKGTLIELLNGEKLQLTNPDVNGDCFWEYWK